MSHIEHSHEASDHLYLEASIQTARSETGFKVSVLRGSLRFRLSRTYASQSIIVEMVGFKAVRLAERGGMNMNTGYEVHDMSERLCCITWTLAEDVELRGGQQYVYGFSALLDARLPRSIKAGASKVYYRMSADVPKLRSLKTETRLNIPWSRSAIMATSETDDAMDSTTIPVEPVGAIVLQVPRTVIKGPDRSMTLRIYPTRPVAEMHVTHISVEILQEVTMYLERLREPHFEPAVSVFQGKADIGPACSPDAPLLMNVPLPAEIHAEMHNPHISVSHVLKVTVHRAGLRQRKTHRQKIVLHHMDLDHWNGRELPLYEQVITQKHNDPVYEYSSLDRKFADVTHNIL